MPRGIPNKGYRVSRKTGKALGRAAGEVKVTSFAPCNEVPTQSQETDDEILAKLEDRFGALSVMAKATAFGLQRSLIISGPAGLGKSYSVEQVIAEAEAKGRVPVVVRGFVRPTGLYRLFYEHRHSKSVIVFDDADSIFSDDIALNLLKAACDSTETRRLSWLAETKMEDEDGERLPRTFEFNGSVIFITNYDFDEMIGRGNKLAPHFEAMISRSHYLDLAMKTKRDYLVRIKQVVMQGMLDELVPAKKDQAELVSFVEQNLETLRELSLRMVLKIAGLMVMQRSEWKKLAKLTCMRG